MQQGSKLAPAVTPRPIKAGQASPKPPPTAARGGRTYTLSMSPVRQGGRATGGDNSPFGGVSPFQPQQRLGGEKTDDAGFRPPELVAHSSPSPSPPPSWRKKPLIIGGDVRNLDNNFALAPPQSNHTRGVSLAHVAAVFSGYGISILPDEAQTLLHEYEENNDAGTGYAAFVADIVESCRRSGNAVVGRGQIKKARLAEHLHKLGARHSTLMDELHDALARHLRVSWTVVRDALRKADTSRSGFLSKRDFARVFERELNVPISSQVLNMLASPPASTSVGAIDARESDLIDYSAFLLQFSSDFQHGDTKTVSESLIFERLGRVTISSEDSGPSSPVSNSLRSPGVSSAMAGYANENGVVDASKIPTKKGAAATTYSAMTADPLVLEQLRILLNDKISSRYSDVKKAFMALDRDGNGSISIAEFTRVLRNFNLDLPPHALEGLMANFDANGDGVVDYREFFAIFGDVIKPSAGNENDAEAAASSASPTSILTHRLYENSSLVFSGHRDVKGANKNRSALSSPGNELKEAFAFLTDESWRAIFVELEASDPTRTGLVPAAELLHVLSKHMGDLPKRHFNSLFRACGSHVNNLMSYRALVRSYRAVVLDPVAYHKQDAHVRAEKTYRKSPTESLVMVWSIRVQRAQLSSALWGQVKDALYAQDVRRAGRIPSSTFARVVQPLLSLSDAQIAFLCVFYEDKLLAQSLAGGNVDGVHIRYASFLTDYEDPGLEASGRSPSAGESGEADGGPRKKRVEGKARVRPPYMQTMIKTNGEAEEDEALAEEKRLRDFCRTNVRALEGRLKDADADGKGFVSLDAFRDVWRQLYHQKGKWKETKASTAFFAKYVSQNNFYYRGLLLDCDAAAGLQTQALIIQDDEDNDVDAGDGGDAFDEEQIGDAPILDAYEAKEAIRHLLTTSRSKQRALYKLFQVMDSAKTGQLTYPEVRRVLERFDVVLSDESARDLLGFYEVEDDAGDKSTGRVKYLQLLHALGGRDPDKLDGLSDISSNCSYYSAIGISPRSVRKPGQLAADSRAASRDSHILAANAVANAIERPNARSGGGGGGAAAAVVERKIQSQLQQLGKIKWKQVAKSLQQVDSDHRGSVTPTAFKKVLDEVGVRLDDEELLRLTLKYDVEQNGRMNYPAFLRNLTNSLSDLTGTTTDSSGFDGLPTLHNSGGRGFSSSPARAMPRGNVVGVPESLRAGIKAKWKPIYASLKTLDKGNVGRVTATQFRQLLEWYALPVPDDLLLLVLRQFDREDGLVDYNAFMRSCIA
jgi:Ca2+-binding EF-hand superfamily protein